FRKCFIFANLLVIGTLPDDWLSAILVRRDGALRILYFMCLIACTSVSAAILFFAVRRSGQKSGVSKFLIGLLAFLVVVEFLLLPINYGVFFTTQELPRVSEVSGEKFPEGTRIWLVWETKDELTYLLRDPYGQRMLLTLPRKESKLKIVGY